MNILSWKLLYNCYGNITVQVKWNKLGMSIPVNKGTRQGGLSSSLLFNIFYKDLVDELACHEGGISIDNLKFNVFCYADDLLLASTAACGLQSLIDCADNYITRHGLRFNPSKQNVLYMGLTLLFMIPNGIYRVQNCKYAQLLII